VGNRLTRTSTSTLPGVANQAFSYDANDRLTSDAYDNNGNTIDSGGNIDRYDFEDRLIDRNNGQITILYDGDGNRVRKTVGGVTTLYLVDDVNPTGYSQVLEELTATSNATPEVARLYVYGLDLIARDGFVVNGWDASFYGYDGIGSTRFLSNEWGDISDSYEYDSQGILIAMAGESANDYLFTGEQHDGDLGLYFLRARYLRPEFARFITQDKYEGTISLPTTLHAYVYAHNDSVNFIDPSGYSEFTVNGQVQASGLQSTVVRFTIRRNIRRINAALCAVAANLANSYSKLPSIPGFQKHHILQNAAFKRIPGYDRGLAMAVYLLGGSANPGSPHDSANKAQPNPARGLTLGQARKISYQALRKAGCRRADATKLVRLAQEYIDSLGKFGLDDVLP
jgi:RHS repeat-associated protein